jgi:hypothetical protein
MRHDGNEGGGFVCVWGGGSAEGCSIETMFYGSRNFLKDARKRKFLFLKETVFIGVAGEVARNTERRTFSPS